VQGIPRVLRPDQRGERQRHLLCRREPILTIKDHAVAAVEHHHGRAGALVFALAHLQVLVIEVQRNLETHTADCGKQRRIDIQVQSVAEFIAAARTVRLDPCRQFPRIVPSKAGLPEGSQQILQSLETQEIERLVGNLEFCLAFRPHGAAALSNFPSADLGCSIVM